MFRKTHHRSDEEFNGEPHIAHQLYVKEGHVWLPIVLPGRPGLHHSRRLLQGAVLCDCWREDPEVWVRLEAETEDRYADEED